MQQKFGCAAVLSVYLLQAAQKKGLSIFFNAAPYDVGILTYPMELVDVLCVNEVEA